MGKLDSIDFQRLAVSLAAAALIAAAAVLGTARPAQAASGAPAADHCVPIRIAVPTAA